MGIFAVIATKFDNSGLRKAQREFGSVGKSIKSTLGAIGIGASLAATVSLVKESVAAAATDLKSQRLLARQLTATTGATDKQIASNEKWLDSLSMAVGVVDDELRPALANAVRGTGSLSKGQKLLKIALDGAAATGKPLTAVMNALIKASNGQTGALYRLAPELKKTKGGLDDFAKSVKGAAQTAADPFARLTVATDSLKEQFGRLLLPSVAKFVDYLTTTVVPAVSKFLDDVANPKTDVGKTFLDIKNAVKSAFGQVKDFFALFGNGDAMKGFGVVASNLVAALPALIALKGILTLASAGKAIANLAKAVGLIQGGSTAAATTGATSALGPIAAGATVIEGYKMGINDAIRKDIKARTGQNFLLYTGSSSTGTMAMPMGLFGIGRQPSIVINSYGSTPAEFDNMIKRALVKHNLINGKK